MSNNAEVADMGDMGLELHHEVITPFHAQLFHLSLYM
jgi:hypothetical protein